MPYLDFSDNCGYSLILCQNLTINSFLNVSYSMESETMQVNISTVKLESIHLSYALNEFLTQCIFLFYSFIFGHTPWLAGS